MHLLQVALECNIPTYEKLYHQLLLKLSYYTEPFRLGADGVRVVVAVTE